MMNHANHSNEKPKGRKLTVILGSVAVILLLAVVLMLVLVSMGTGAPEETLPPETTVATEPETQPETTAPAETEPVILENLRELYEQNSDLAGWLRIDDTVVDYPVMYTPENDEKYLRADFEGNYATAGCLFIKGTCSLEPESDNLIIYGHNMRNGSMFHTLLNYKNKSYWEEHPTIMFSTLYEEREYEVLAAFYDRVYYSYEDVFKFYKFVDAEDEADFNNAIANYEKKAIYDTGVNAEYGDRLLTLITCSYHTKNGRFVVVARQTVDKEEILSEETVEATNP